MQSVFNYDGPLMSFLRKIWDIFIINMLWLVCSIPIITMGAATTAAYDGCFRILHKEEGRVVQPFFKAFKENLKQATLIWLAFIFTLALIAFEIYLILRMGLLKTILGLVLVCVFGISAVVVIFAGVYVFALQSYFENSLVNTLKNALIMGMSSYGYSLLMIILDIVVGFATLLCAPIFFPMLPLLTNTLIINKVFQKYITKSEQDKQL